VVGDTTVYVINKAPCRVILTAPAGDGPRKHREPPPPGDPARRIRRRAKVG
jgi:hypothetical protein